MSKTIRDSFTLCERHQIWSRAYQTYRTWARERGLKYLKEVDWDPVTSGSCGVTGCDNDGYYRFTVDFTIDTQRSLQELDL